MEDKTCFYCGTSFKYRRNKFFCSIKCKNEFHNNRNYDLKEPTIKINKILHKNWKILSDFYKKSTDKPISSRDIEKEGFNTKYYTNIIQEQVTKYYVVYNYGYCIYQNLLIKIIKL